MVDPIFQNPAAVEDVSGRITKISGAPAERREAYLFTFAFDFGSGKEPVSVKLVPKMYGTKDADYHIPQGIAGVVLYAPIGPGYAVELEESLWDKVREGGFILSEYTLRTKNTEGKVISTELGS